MRPVYLLAFLLLVFVPSSSARIFGHHIAGHGHHHQGGHHRTPPNETALEAKCSTTDFPAVCASAAAPYASAYSVLDDKAMLSIIVSASNVSARAAATKAFNLANDLKTAPLVAMNVATCPSGFKDALDDLESAKYSTASGDGGTVTVALSALFSSYAECTDIFDDHPTVQPNPMAADTVRLEHLANIALTFAYKAFGIAPPATD